jgi:hypothetical protein
MRHAFRRAAIPLAAYYAVTLAFPFANGAAGPAFFRHAAVVLMVPLVLILLLWAVRALPTVYGIRYGDRQDHHHPSRRSAQEGEDPGRFRRRSNLSAFVKHAVDVAIQDAAGWRAMLDEALEETGGPLTDKERAWVDSLLHRAPKKRARRKAA